ncbi:type II secretion system GspH family protein [Patescibacteria group bacterium]|nr:type II secretion system GspH family protein [Patescibacteria group bacterium]MBU1500426.1 type II secretion system GspH family protein [Patescibacteria group bacterium]MBU2080494.1 type II secretion system GspH family protein [Patescibacteria group bacterium]MBU2123701.1 type II secretion system GspH family protein [Patescibacteria group bacterium]MBU2194557.1 type II secretion system GspH family protein [Patescibacteria group bacterium]
MKRAFTLVETIVVVAILATVGVGLLTMIAYFYRSNAYVLEQTTALDSAHRGIDEAFGILREASYGEDGAFPLAAAATSSIMFYSDIDIDTPVERVHLYLSNGTMYQGVTNAAGNPPSYVGQPETTYTIATYVKNATSTPIFRYYNTVGTELTGTINLADVASVKLRLDVDLNPLRAPNILTIEQSATLRNLRY